MPSFICHAFTEHLLCVWLHGRHSEYSGELDRHCPALKQVVVQQREKEAIEQASAMTGGVSQGSPEKSDQQERQRHTD